MVEASSATQALAQVARADHPYDLVITDVVMPGISGPQLVKQLRAQRPGLPVLFRSGHPVGDLSGAGGILPGERLIQKPFTPESLVSVVADALTHEVAERSLSKDPPALPKGLFSSPGPHITVNSTR